jgi:DNA-binding IclR family transcriptional regulator
MSGLAKATGLPASRTTRLVADLQPRGFVTEVASSPGARQRGQAYPRGTAKLKFATQLKGMHK